MSHNFRAAGAQGAAAQAAGFGVNFLQGGISGLRAGNGRIRRHDARDVSGGDDFQNFIKRFEGQVRGDFHENGRGGGFWKCTWKDICRALTRRGHVDFLQRGEYFIKRDLVLQLAEVGRVGGTDVDDKKVREPAQDAERAGIVCRRFFERRDFGFSEVDADGMRRPQAGFFPTGQLFGNGFRTGIVEAHAVDNAFIRNGAEHPGLGIAILRVPRDAAQFGETETERSPAGDGGRMFVHTRGQTNGIGKFQTKNIGGHFRRAVKSRNRIEEKPAPTGAGERVDRLVMRHLGVLPEEQGTDQLFMEPAHLE